MYELSKRTSNFSDSVIRRMTRIANKYDAVNLSQGFPDFAPPKEITDRLSEVAKMGPHQYAITKCERKAPKFIYGDISSLKNNDSISLFFIVLYF